MNYTKQVREYCGKHSKGLIDISVVRNTVFSDIPYKTLLKIFNRLEEEGIVKTVSKGVYSIGKKKIDERKILSDYTSNGKGMVVGYALYNKIGLTLYQDERIVILLFCKVKRRIKLYLAPFFMFRLWLFTPQ